MSIEKAVALASASGVRILAGTDVGSAYSHAGFSLHEEMEWLVKAGLTPRDALRSATSNPAAFFRDEYGIGTMKDGSVASFVLLNDNPLKDIRNVGKIHAVILKGKALLRNDLDELLRTAEAEAAAGR